MVDSLKRVPFFSYYAGCHAFIPLKINWWSYHSTDFDRIIFFSPTMQVRKRISETQNTIRIWVIRAMIAKGLNYTIKFNCIPHGIIFWRVQAENWCSENRTKGVIYYFQSNDKHLSCNCMILSTNKGDQINFNLIRSWT